MQNSPESIATTGAHRSLASDAFYPWDEIITMGLAMLTGGVLLLCPPQYNAVVFAAGLLVCILTDLGLKAKLRIPYGFSDLLVSALRAMAFMVIGALFIGLAALAVYSSISPEHGAHSD